MSAAADSVDRAKRSALDQIRDSYEEARQHASSGPAFANLEWILGPKENRFQHAAELNAKMIELLGLWLDDLAAEVDQPVMLIAGSGESLTNRNSLGVRLRAATKAFLVAFRLH